MVSLPTSNSEKILEFAPLPCPLKIYENLKTPNQVVDVKKPTIMDPKEPLFKTIRQMGSLIPGAAASVNLLVDQVEASTNNITTQVVDDGATLRGLNMSKDGRQGIMGGLISDGYVYIGEDPETQDSFNVDDEDGQRKFTTVVLNEEDARRHQ